MKYIEYTMHSPKKGKPNAGRRDYFTDKKFLEEIEKGLSDIAHQKVKSDKDQKCLKMVTERKTIDKTAPQNQPLRKMVSNYLKTTDI